MINPVVRKEQNFNVSSTRETNLYLIGKSSVLEGLTDLPFPRNSVLCTTFATKVIFRRSPSKSITVSIIPAQTSDDEHIREVQGWGRDLDSPLDSFEFANIFKEVAFTPYDLF